MKTRKEEKWKQTKQKRRCTACGVCETQDARMVEFLFDGVAWVRTLQVRCQSCGELSTVFSRLADIQARIAQAIVSGDKALSAEEITWLRKYLGFSSEDFGNFVGYSRAWVSAWENGRKPIPRAVERLVREVALKGPQLTDYGELDYGPKEYKPARRRPVKVEMSNESRPAL